MLDLLGHNLILGLECNRWIFASHIKSNGLFVSISHWHWNGGWSRSFVLHLQFAWIIWLNFLQEFVNNLFVLIFVLFLDFMEQLHSGVNPVLFHFDLLVELNNFFHQLHHCKILDGKIFLWFLLFWFHNINF